MLSQLHLRFITDSTQKAKLYLCFVSPNRASGNRFLKSTMRLIEGTSFQQEHQPSSHSCCADSSSLLKTLLSPRIAQRGCCRAKSDLRSESCSKPEAPPARDSRSRRTERKKGGREQEWRTRQEKRRRGSTRRSQLLREEGTDQLSRRA